MRPPEFTGGNPKNRPRSVADPYASMRPPEFTGGNAAAAPGLPAPGPRASMRPPEFTGGNGLQSSALSAVARSFNEAAGIHRRKPFYDELMDAGYFMLQ